MRFLVSTALILSVLLIYSCEESTTSNKDLATLQGNVYAININSETQPVEGALITVQNKYGQAVSDANGAFALQVELTTEEEQLAIIATKVGFEPGVSQVFAKKGVTVTVPDFTLISIYQDSTGDGDEDGTGLVLPPSGDGSNIEIYGSHDTQVYVAHTGLQQTAKIRFKITDSEGNLVDSEHKVLVNFELESGPGGGEFVFPDTMTTNNGIAYTVLNTGTVAGPVRVRASFSVNGNTYYSNPIRLAIYGGLPDEDHFSVAVNKLNIAGRVRTGLLDQVTAFVGDKYSNPVAPGTIVYFYSDYCIIEGSAVTDELGRASVYFMSSNPLPPFPAVSSMATVTAKTYKDTLQADLLEKSNQILLSDITGQIIFDPDTFSYTDTNTPKLFNFSVSDIWGYPLVSNTSIQVDATEGDLFGDVSINLGDHQVAGNGVTNFQFAWVPGDSLETPVVYITIKVSPPADGNGYRSRSISGYKR